MNRNHLRLVAFAPASLLALLPCTLSSAARAQDRVWKVVNDKDSDFFGESMDVLGDLDGDGVSDLIVGESYNYVDNLGRAIAYSGMDGSSLGEIVGNIDESLGAAVSRTGDVDGDGIPDFAVSMFDPGGIKHDTGRVTVYSGRTFSSIWQVDGNFGDFLGSGIADMGDLDGDGIDDLIVGARFGYYARGMSGKDGSTLFTVTSPSLFPGDFPWTVAAGGDVDGDGVGDFMLSDPYTCDLGPCSGAAYVFSGKTQQLLYTLHAQYDAAYMGLGMAILGDVNGDGFADFGAGAPGETNGASLNGGYAIIGSGKDGSTLFTYDEYRGGHDNWGTGWCFGAVGDLNHDGFDEFLIASPGAGDYDRPGNVYLYSGRDGGVLYHYQDIDSSAFQNEFGFAISILPASGGRGPEFAATSPFEITLAGHVGSVSTWSTCELYVDAEPRIATKYNPVTLQLGQGLASQLYAFFLVDVNGTTAFQLLSLGYLDASGRGYLSGSYNGGLQGMTLDFRGITLDGAGKPIVSNTETMYFQ